MNLISIDKITKFHSNKLLFEDVSTGINEGEKVALIGINGCGKSTLLNIIAGFDQPDKGSVLTNNDLKPSILRQNLDFSPQETIKEHVFGKTDKKLLLIKEYEECIENPDCTKFEQLNEEMERENAWAFESHLKEILHALGIKDLNQKMGELSGGMLKKIGIAETLIKESNIIILDEPTNHLDMETIVWLENYLKNMKKALLMVTHDRYFLDSICTSIWEIHRKKLHIYKGNYSFYLEKHAEKEHSLQKAEERIETILKQEFKWLNRGARARTTKSKGRINKINEMVQREKPEEEKELELSIKTRRLGKKILELKNISFAWENKPIIKNFTYSFKKGEKIGIIGTNGCGKSTLLDIIVGKIKPNSGEIDKGVNTFFGYFDQTAKELPLEMKLIDYIKKDSEMIELGNGQFFTPSQMLEKFLFDSAQHYTPIKKLSGGEKRRLQLVKVLMQNPNFIVLDEPTNDIDIKTLSILEDFLIKFKGVLVVVSHDRYFLDRTTEHILYFDKNNNIQGYEGSATEFLLENKKSTKKKPKENIVEKIKTKKIKLTFKEKKELELLDEEIPKLEEELKKLEEELADTTKTPEDLGKIGLKYEKIQQELDEKTERWLVLQEKNN